MDDFGLYIKKEIANLIKRSKTPQNSTRNSNLIERFNRKQIFVAKSLNKPLWHQYQRQKTPEFLSKTSSKKQIKNTVCSNSLLIKQMIAQQNLANNKLNKHKKQSIPARFQRQRQLAKDSKKSKRSTIYKRVSQPLPFNRQISGISDNYLQAKRTFSKRNLVSTKTIEFFEY